MTRVSPAWRDGWSLTGGPSCGAEMAGLVNGASPSGPHRAPQQRDEDLIDARCALHACLLKGLFPACMPRFHAALLHPIHIDPLCAADNAVQASGAIALSRVLYKCDIHTLDLAGMCCRRNGIGNDEGGSLFQFLLVNLGMLCFRAEARAWLCPLRPLYHKDNDIKVTGAEAIGMALAKGNNTLTDLSLAGNSISGGAIAVLAQCLMPMKRVKRLNLSREPHLPIVPRTTLPCT